MGAAGGDGGMRGVSVAAIVCRPSTDTPERSCRRLRAASVLPADAYNDKEEDAGSMQATPAIIMMTTRRRTPGTQPLKRTRSRSRRGYGDNLKICEKVLKIQFHLNFLFFNPSILLFTNYM